MTSGMAHARPKRMTGLTRSSPEPLYRQLAQHLESAIGELAPGDRLDS